MYVRIISVVCIRTYTISLFCWYSRTIDVELEPVLSGSRVRVEGERRLVTIVN